MSADGGFTAMRRTAEHGFTLIEVMVALTVFSLAALALLRLEGATLANTGALENKAIGQIVARNIAVEALTDPVAPTLGVVSGEAVNAGRRWRWTRRTKQENEGRLQRIDIAVTDETGRSAGGLIIFRPAI